ncbi:urease accessory protein UreD [Gemmobacter serpentinus]|uniref:urease accessory protein UreD n=1 Tax=Gemmobacter serpentinus TaxID=2652247 RepID=UPI00124F0A13|nr:urease accessory protein UreD [Gemmobacter serpentinus]
MLDAHLQVGLQRSRGEARLSLIAGDSKARIADLHQSGSAKIMLPNRALEEGVFLNTSGGLTGGDSLQYSLNLAPDVAFTATTQTAERAYASLGDQAVVEIGLELGVGARLDWLPQETLIYDRARLRRRTQAKLGCNARLLLAETVVLGRQAMGETPDHAALRDLRRVTQAGRPIWCENLCLDATSLAARSGPALLGGARCFSTIALIAPEAEAQLPLIRDLLAAEGVSVAASAWNGRLILRLTSEHLWPLRQHLARILTRLRGKPMPRVWQLHGDII